MVLTHITTGFPKPNFLVLFSVLSFDNHFVNRFVNDSTENEN
jgi:hypothetical protein